MRHLQRLLFAAIAVAALVLVPTASAQVKSISAGSGQLGPNGSTILVPVSMQCDPGINVAFIDAELQQIHGNSFAQGFGNFTSNFPGVPCDTGFTTTILITATPTSAPFKPGKAVLLLSGAVNTRTLPLTFTSFSQTVFIHIGH